MNLLGALGGAVVGPVVGVLAEVVLLNSMRWDSHLLWYSPVGAIVGFFFPRAVRMIVEVILDLIPS